jgi:hypothetical protein
MFYVIALLFVLIGFHSSLLLIFSNGFQNTVLTIKRHTNANIFQENVLVAFEKLSRKRCRFG